MAVFTIPKPEPTKVASSNRHLPVMKVTTFAPGTLIPILCKDVLPGDKFRINIDSLIESLPMVAPNLNGYKASFDFYFCPWSNYYGWMDNNKRQSTAEIIDKKRHTFLSNPATVGTAETFAQTRPGVKPGSLLDYLGLPPGFIGRPPMQGSALRVPIPAEKLLSVLDIYRSYYVNNQEEFCSFASGSRSSSPAPGGIGPGDDVVRVPLSVMDDLFLKLRTYPDGVSLNSLADALPDLINGFPMDVATYGDFFTQFLGLSNISALGGLPLRTYRMDLNRGLLSTKVGELKSTVQITNDGFSVDTLRFANKLQKLIDRIDISGGRFSDMMRVRWGVTPRGSLDIPDYLGSVSEFFGITDVVSTASGMNDSVAGDRGNSILGQQAGFAVNRLKRDNAPISFRADQFGTLVCMFSLVPIVTYSQGIEREDLKTTFAEVYDPAFAQLGYQDVDGLELTALPAFDLSRVTSPTSNLYWKLTPVNSSEAVGKRIAWSEYLSSLPRAHGLFAYGQDFDYWANNRMYTVPGELPGDFAAEDPENTEIARSALTNLLYYADVDFSTYINPSLQNHLFADVSFASQNFRLRVNFDMSVRRNIGSRVMPHL